jgi:hypothetical protein
VEMNCQISIPEVSGLESQVLTVGRHFLFVCEGDTGSFDFAKAQLVTAEADKYTFHLIKAFSNQSKSGATFDMVSYMAGDISASALTMTDGTNQIIINTQPVKLTSVLPPPEKNSEGTAKPPEPYGYNILNVSWPLSYTIFFVVLFCALIAGLITQGMRARRFRRLNQELKDYDSAQAPDLQFYKHIRLLEKRNFPIKDVERQFHIYAIRRYQVPLFGLSVGEANSYLKKIWPTLINERRELKNILSDLKKMSLKENPEETKKYLNKLYEFVDHSEEKLGGQS